MAINSYVGAEIVSSSDTFNVWLTRTNSIITDMGSVVVSVGSDNVGDITITGVLGANTVFAGEELRGGDANTSGDLTVTSAAIFDTDVTISGDILFNGASANVNISTLNLIVDSTNTIFNDHVAFNNDMIIPVGTTGARGVSETGNSRFNTTTGKFEVYTGSLWGLKADTADALTTSRTLSLSGDVSGSVGFDGSSSVSITTTLVNSAQTIETVQDIVGGMVVGNTETGISVIYQDGDGTLDFAIDEASIQHDSLDGFVANEHIDHSLVVLTAGSGLTGGGTITASRSFSVDETNVNHDGLLNFVANEHIDHSSVSITAGTGLSGGGDLTLSRSLSVNEPAVNHDNLLNFVANEHINHASVSVLAGNGLTGGGTIASSRTLTVQAGLGLVANTTGIHIDPSAVITINSISTTNTSITNLTVGSISANSSVGIAGQFLATNGTTAYWADVSEFTGETDTLDSVTDRGATTTNVLNVGGLVLSNTPTFALTGEVTGSATFNGSNTTITTTINPTSNVEVVDLKATSITANNSLGTVGQFLASNGTTIYWADVSEFTGEADTLDTVTDRGATTTNVLNVGGLVLSNAPTFALTGDATGSATFNGSNTTIDVTIDANSVKDTVGAMFSSNSESGINVVYQTSDNTVDFDVDDFVITLGGDLTGATTITNLGNATLNATVVGGAADTLSTARTITLAGEVSGNTTFDGSGDVTITTNLETVNGFTSNGDIILSGADLDGFVTATYASQFAVSATSGAITVNWNEGQNQIQAEPTGSITYTFTAPAGPGHFQLIIASDGTSTAQAITFPGNVKWMGTPYAGINDKAAVINFYYDGSAVYYAIASYEN
jgi:hypothetical protein